MFGVSLSSISLKKSWPKADRLQAFHENDLKAQRCVSQAKVHFGMEPVSEGPPLPFLDLTRQQLDTVVEALKSLNAGMLDKLRTRLERVSQGTPFPFIRAGEQCVQQITANPPAPESDLLALPLWQAFLTRALQETHIRPVIPDKATQKFDPETMDVEHSIAMITSDSNLDRQIINVNQYGYAVYPENVEEKKPPLFIRRPSVTFFVAAPAYGDQLPVVDRFALSKSGELSPELQGSKQLLERAFFALWCPQEAKNVLPSQFSPLWEASGSLPRPHLEGIIRARMRFLNQEPDQTRLRKERRGMAILYKNPRHEGSMLFTDPSAAEASQLNQITVEKAITHAYMTLLEACEKKLRNK